MNDVPTSFNQQPIFDKFQKQGFRDAKHNPFKVAWWALNLISGRYKQGVGLLEDTDGTFCCLGVGAKIFDLDRRVCGPKSDQYIQYRLDENHTWSETFIDPGFFLDGGRKTVDYPDFAEANDEREITFRQIGFWLLSTLLPSFRRK